MGALRLDLGSCGECDERIAMGRMLASVAWRFREWSTKVTTHVNVMASSPPPAPARACAILSPCCAADVAGVTSLGFVLSAMLALSRISELADRRFLR